MLIFFKLGWVKSLLEIWKFSLSIFQSIPRSLSSGLIPSLASLSKHIRYSHKYSNGFFESASKSELENLLQYTDIGKTFTGDDGMKRYRAIMKFLAEASISG